MLTVNNNISISGKYKLLWWDQDESFSQFKTFLMKIGLVEELAYWNLNLVNLGKPSEKKTQKKVWNFPNRGGGGLCQFQTFFLIFLGFL